jgi:hypothetical protein
MLQRFGGLRDGKQFPKVGEIYEGPDSVCDQFVRFKVAERVEDDAPAPEPEAETADKRETATNDKREKRDK